MAYTITLTDGTVLTTVANETVDTTTSMTLIGRDFSGYGTFIAENFIHLLESFANTSPPPVPLTGQLFYNKSTAALQLWTGTAWVNIGFTSGGAVTGDITLDGSLICHNPAAPTHERYWRIRISDTVPYVGMLVFEALDDDGATVLNTVVAMDGIYANLGLIPEVANESALPAAGTAPYPVYYVDAYAGYQGQPALASKFAGSWYYYPSQLPQYWTDSGGANLVAIAPAPPLTSLANFKKPFLVKINATNSGPSTLAVNALPATPIITPVGAALVPGQMVAGGIAELIYDGTNFQLLNPNPTGGRVKLLSNLNLYVSNNASNGYAVGSDSFSGLTRTAPFSTLQHAWTSLQTQYDFNGFSATVNINNGTYAGMVANGALVGATAGTSAVTFNGNGASPSSVVISAPSSNCFSASNGANFTVFAVSLTATGSGSTGIGIEASNGATINYNGVIFDACSTAHVYAGNLGVVNAAGSYAINGGALYHCVANIGNVVITGITVTISSTPNFNFFALVENCGVAQIYSCAFSGGATGNQYDVLANGVLYTNGAPTGTFLPPYNATGTVSTGGQVV